MHFPARSSSDKLRTLSYSPSVWAGCARLGASRKVRFTRLSDGPRYGQSAPRLAVFEGSRECAGSTQLRHSRLALRGSKAGIPHRVAIADRLAIHQTSGVSRLSGLGFLVGILERKIAFIDQLIADYGRVHAESPCGCLHGFRRGIFHVKNSLKVIERAQQTVR